MTPAASALETGYDVPAKVGDSLADIETPALIIDLDAFERNCHKMRTSVESMNVRLRAHAKTDKSADIALYQIAEGGACGICCQKVSEAEALVRAGVRDILIANQVCAHAKIERLAKLSKQARIIVCVDDAANIADLSAAAGRHGMRASKPTRSMPVCRRSSAGRNSAISAHPTSTGRSPTRRASSP